MDADASELADNIETEITRDLDGNWWATARVVAMTRTPLPPQLVEELQIRTSDGLLIGENPDVKKMIEAMERDQLIHWLTQQLGLPPGFREVMDAAKTHARSRPDATAGAPVVEFHGMTELTPAGYGYLRTVEEWDI